MTSVQQTVLEKLQKLSPKDQEKVLDFVESLLPLPGPESTATGRQPLRGRLAHLNLRITADDIAEIREEIWPGDSKK
jgi:mRNA-degrading endonuclease RelE of RelBE toxin-antitoxin system